MTRFLLLFDIDGTLTLTQGAGPRAMQRVSDRLFGEGFSWEVDMAGKLDPAIYREAAAMNKLENADTLHEMYHEQYIEELAIELDRSRDKVLVMPGVHDLLGALHERVRTRGDIMLGLLTGNYALAAPIKLRAADVDPGIFEITAFGDEGETRPDLTALALRKYQALTGEKPEPHKVVVIGDTPLDVACAKAHGCVAYAVATGRHSVEQLRAAGADVVAENLADPSPLYAIIG